MLADDNALILVCQNNSPEYLLTPDKPLIVINVGQADQQCAAIKSFAKSASQSWSRDNFSNSAIFTLCRIDGMSAMLSMQLRQERQESWGKPTYCGDGKPRIGSFRTPSQSDSAFRTFDQTIRGELSAFANAARQTYVCRQVGSKSLDDENGVQAAIGRDLAFLIEAHSRNCSQLVGSEWSWRIEISCGV